MAFKIQTGINISHWLSQSLLHGTDREANFTKDDLLKISDAGFDHVRLPVDEVQLWLEDGSPDNHAFDILNEAIYGCTRQNIRAIIDMHILKSHYFNDSKEPMLYSDQKELDHFCNLWTQISKHMREWPTDSVAFEILNEPKAKNYSDWNRVSMEVFKTLRSLESERTLILGSNWYCKAETFDVLEIPDDLNMMLTFHFYDPMLITHHKASWTNIGCYDGRLNYPGLPIDKEIFEKISEPVKSKIKNENYYFDRDTIVEKLEKPLEVRNKTGKTVFCGEFGCIKHTPHELSCKWYRDIVSVFREYDIPFTHWDLHGIFGIFDNTPDENEIIGILRGCK